MRPRKDVIGQKFGLLLVIKLAGKNRSGSYTYQCKCDCGKYSIVNVSSLINGNTSSCGCLRLVNLSKSLTTHGKSGVPEYTIWSGINERCGNPKHVGYPYYGGRGITVCDEWKHDFAQFYADMGPRPSADYSIERDNPNGNYTKSNCRWLLKKDQGRNKRTSRWIEHNGMRMILIDWAVYLKMDKSTLIMHLKNKTIEQVIDFCIRKEKRKKIQNEQLLLNPGGINEKNKFDALNEKFILSNINEVEKFVSKDMNESDSLAFFRKIKANIPYSKKSDRNTIIRRYKKILLQIKIKTS